MQRVTLQNPTQTEPDSSLDPVSLYRLQSIGGAAREKAAGARQERRYKAAISYKDDNDSSVTRSKHYLWRLP